MTKDSADGGDVDKDEQFDIDFTVMRVSWPRCWMTSCRCWAEAMRSRRLLAA